MRENPKLEEHYEKLMEMVEIKFMKRFNTIIYKVVCPHCKANLVGYTLTDISSSVKNHLQHAHPELLK